MPVRGRKGCLLPAEAQPAPEARLAGSASTLQTRGEPASQCRHLGLLPLLTPPLVPLTFHTTVAPSRLHQSAGHLLQQAGDPLRPMKGRDFDLERVALAVVVAFEVSRVQDFQFVAMETFHIIVISFFLRNQLYCFTISSFRQVAFYKSRL